MVYVQEEMSDLRSLIRFKEKELRCLEWSLMAQKAQGSGGAYVPESLREELEDRRTEQQVGFCINFQIIQSQGETSKREQDVGLLWQIQIWASHMGNHTSTKAESLQAKRDILVLQGLLLGCPVATAQIHAMHCRHCQMRKN